MSQLFVFENNFVQSLLEQLQMFPKVFALLQCPVELSTAFSMRPTNPHFPEPRLVLGGLKFFHSRKQSRDLSTLTFGHVHQPTVLRHQLFVFKFQRSINSPALKIME